MFLFMATGAYYESGLHLFQWSSIDLHVTLEVELVLKSFY